MYECKRLLYQLNEDDCYFDRKVCPPGFNKLPQKLKVEDAQRQEYRSRGISQVIRSKRTKVNIAGRRVRVFLTGLLPTQHGRTFCGDHFEIVRGRKFNSFLVFQFSTCGRYLVIDFAPRIKVLS